MKNKKMNMNEVMMKASAYSANRPVTEKLASFNDEFSQKLAYFNARINTLNSGKETVKIVKAQAKEEENETKKIVGENLNDSIMTACNAVYREAVKMIDKQDWPALYGAYADYLTGKTEQAKSVLFNTLKAYGIQCNNKNAFAERMLSGLGKNWVSTGFRTQETIKHGKALSENSFKKRFIMSLSDYCTTDNRASRKSGKLGAKHSEKEIAELIQVACNDLGIELEDAE